MSIHHQVLDLIRKEKILIDQVHYQFLIDQREGRLDLPRDLTSSEKEQPRRGENPFYADCVLVDRNNKPKMLIEVVSSNPQDPNGIVGLVANLDRLARFPRGDYSGVDLLFVVLGQMRRYWCSLCKRGHSLSRSSRHFLESWQAVKNKSPVEILHKGLATSYRKALVDNPTAPYLRAIRAPSVLFLNSEKISNDWRTYQSTVLKVIKTHIGQRIQDAERNADPVFVGVEQLFPEAITQMLGIA
jgi:hypothetical protein